MGGGDVGVSGKTEWGVYHEPYALGGGSRKKMESFDRSQRQYPREKNTRKTVSSASGEGSNNLGSGQLKKVPFG